MSDFPYEGALVIGAGTGISASVARLLAKHGVKVGLAARNTEKLAVLSREIGATVYATDASQADQVEALFATAEQEIGNIDIVIYNASSRLQGALEELDPNAVEQSIKVSAFAGFLVVQQAARYMSPRGRGAILLTGATASKKAYAYSAPFAMGKFALRALSHSAARELGPKGIHVAHFIIDGLVRGERHQDPSNEPDSTLNPEDIAQAYVDVLLQRRSAWSLEVDLRPWRERF